MTKPMTRAETKKRCLFVLDWWDVELLNPTYKGGPGCILQIALESDDAYPESELSVNEEVAIAFASDSHDATRLRALVEAL